MTEARPSRLPLYLVGGSVAEINADGPALAVAREGCAIARYPVGRLLHVVTRDDHAWSRGALQLCLVHRLPLLFVDGEGRLLGALRPRVPRPEAAGEAIARLAWETGESWRLENWVHAERLNALSRVDNAGEGRALHRLARAEGPLPPPPDTAERQVSVAMRAMVETRLQEAGVPAHYPVRGGGWWDLAGELEDILRLRWLAEAGRLARHARMSKGDRLAWLHRRANRYERAAASALDRLQRLAREADTPWP